MATFDKKRKPRGKPFEKGNKIGHRFGPGESGNPGGRPKSDISPTRILEELARVAFIDPRKLFDEAGNLLPISQLDEDTARAIAGLDHEKLFEHFGKGQAKHVGTTVKIKQWDKVRALELLGKYHKLFTEKLELTGLEGLADRINKIRQRKHGHGGD